MTTFEMMWIPYCLEILLQAYLF
uniref:Uncharacterized protein n=1 Tax=Arundo donax TaxID=35708 RepID=A0A0A9GVY4_ARUDO